MPVFISEWNLNGERADGTPAQHAAFLAASLFWMQESSLAGACFFCAENYKDMKRGLLDDKNRLVEAARVLAMFARLPAQRVDARWNNPEFTVLAGRGGGKLGVMVSRNSAAAAAGPAALTLKLGGLGQPGLRQVDLCMEDAASAGGARSAEELPGSHRRGGQGRHGNPAAGNEGLLRPPRHHSACDRSGA